MLVTREALETSQMVSTAIYYYFRREASSGMGCASFYSTASFASRLMNLATFYSRAMVPLRLRSLYGSRLSARTAPASRLVFVGASLFGAWASGWRLARSPWGRREPLRSARAGAPVAAATETAA